MEELVSQEDFVPASGPEDADIMIVGEAPGKQEVKQKKPFVGRAGRLLNDKLSDAGIIRSACYVTNVVKERPHRNNISHFVEINKNGIKNATSKYWEYVRMLEAEIRDVDPNIIVAAGNVPMYTLIEEYGITNWRGSVVECGLVPGYKVAPILHPAAALRKFEWRHLITFDLQNAKKHSKSPEVPEDDRDYIIEPTFEQATSYLKSLRDEDVFGFDIELYNQEVGCISFSRESHEAISIPFVEYGKDYFSPPQEAEIWNLIAEALEDPNTGSIAHNAFFDTMVLLRKYGICSRNIHDTMVACKILYPPYSKGLDFVTSLFTDLPYYKDQGKDYFESGGDREQFWLYNAKDSVVLTEAFPKMMNQLKRLDNIETYERQRKLIPPLLFMTRRGIKMNTDKMDQKSMKAEAEILALEAKIAEEAGHAINPRSSKQLKAYFYDELGLDPYISRKTGNPTTDKTALKRLSRRGYKVADLVLKVREKSKMKGTYYDMDLDPDGRLRCSMDPVGTKSGRLSSRQTLWGTGANMQNQPYEMREMMLVDDGYVGFEIDLGQAENRLVAMFGPDPKMMEAFKTGQDIHSLTASFIFGGEATKEVQDNKTADIGHGNQSQRQWGKRANHGLNYGMGYKKFSLVHEISENEAKRIHDKYHKIYPGVKKFHKKVKNKLRSNRVLTNPYGRTRKFFDRWGNQLFQEAYNWMAQSTVADHLHENGVLELYYNDHKYKPVEFLNDVHDSIWFQIPLDIGWKSIGRIIKDICDALERPIEYEGRELVIPAETQICPDNFKVNYEFDHIPDASELEGKYHEMKKG